MSAPFSVAVPTIGLTDMLLRCLRSIGATRPMPDEILVLDQSDVPDALERALGRLDVSGLRRIRCTGRGIARNMNLALREAAHDTLFVTHDDCSVAADWTAAGLAAFGGERGLVTGRVVPPPGVDRRAVPSVKVSERPEIFTGRLVHGALFPNNMVLERDRALALGGFDEREGFATAAEDLDFGYRWLKSGAPMRYSPGMCVTHHNWREPESLTPLYRHYARTAGRFYAKHLCAGDMLMLRWIAADLGRGAAAWGRRFRRGGERWADERLELPLHMPLGVLEGIGYSLTRRAR